MATMGDVMATKRLGEVKAGRRVVGRQKVNFRTLRESNDMQTI